MRDEAKAKTIAKAKEFARALSTLDDVLGMEPDELIAVEAFEIKEDTPPEDMALMVARLMAAPDGRWGLYRRNNELIAWDEESGDFAPMTARRFRTWLPINRGIVFVKKKVPLKDPEGNHTGEFMVVKGQLTKDKAECLLASDELRMAVPEIKGMHPVRLPVFEGGDVRLLPEGYDPATGIFTHSEVTFAENMEFDDGVNQLFNIYHTFGWRSENRDMAIHFAAMLSIFCRMLYVGKSPAFAYIANIQSSGKTNLAWCASWAVFGTRRTMPLLKDKEDKLQEALNSAALAGVCYTIFDNIDWGGAEVKTELLDQWISNAEWDFRKLGGNIMAAPKLQGVTIFTGNNIKLSPDLERRTLMCDLWNPLAAADRPKDPNMILIGERFFLDAKNRAHLLACMWAIVKEWNKVGRPKGTKTLDSFEGWAEVVPGIVLHAGKVFNRTWDCMAPNLNENIGDKAARDYKRLAQIAMDEFGKNPDGSIKEQFEVTVQQLAGVARRHSIEEVQAKLWPEKDIESVKATERKDGGWRYKPVATKPRDQWSLEDEETPPDEADRDRQAAEYLTPTSRSALGNELKKRLHELYFMTTGGEPYKWLHRAGVTPARYAVERVKAKANA
jgi:hypothetical protein